MSPISLVFLDVQPIIQTKYIYYCIVKDVQNSPLFFLIIVAIISIVQKYLYSILQPFYDMEGTENFQMGLSIGKIRSYYDSITLEATETSSLNSKNESIFSNAPIYEYQCDITMTHDCNLSTARSIR